MYNPSPILTNVNNPSCIPAIETQLEGAGEYILLEDFNLHYPSWNNSNRFTYYREVDIIVIIIKGRDIELLLSKGVVI